MKCKIDFQKLSTTVKSIMVSNKLDGITGIVVDTSTNKRSQVFFDHNNNGDEVKHFFWFDNDTIILSDVII